MIILKELRCRSMSSTYSHNYAHTQRRAINKDTIDCMLECEEKYSLVTERRNEEE